MKYKVSFPAQRNMIPSHVKITNKFSEVKKWPLLRLHNPLKSTQMYSWIIETSSFLPRKSSVIFGNFGKCSETIVWPSNNFWRIFGNLQEIFKKLSLVRLCQIIHRIIHDCLLFWNLTRCAHSSWTLGEKFQIYSHPCIMLYIIYKQNSRLSSSVRYASGSKKPA